MWRALLLLALVPPALASQVFYETLTRAQVVEQSPVILRVEPTGAAARILTVPMVGPNGPVPPYQTHVDRMRVVEVLRAPAGTLKAGQEVEVGPPEMDDQLHMHRRYHVEGVSKSPMFGRHESGLPPEATRGRHIVFLRTCTIETETVLCATVRGAVAADADRDDVLALAAAHPWPEGAEIRIPTP